jgi:hypothetical protein
MRWDLKMKRDKERRLRAAEATACGAADGEDVDPNLCMTSLSFVII